MQFASDSKLSPLSRKFLSLLEVLADRLLAFNSRIEAIPGKLPELICVILYSAAHMVISYFHEPWYDEAVAWQIAKCASIKDILLEIPHYEGHPQLWHLLLVPFAKSGMPYELSLSLISLVFAGAAMVVLLWFAPFPRTIKLLLPFTFFFFYQYGVISRPYCIMMLSLMLLAMAYGSRNMQPHRYVLCLMLLCLTSAYGIVLAGGLAMVWVWEILREQAFADFLRHFWKDKRIWWLAALLGLALALIASILPQGDTLAAAFMFEDSPETNLLVRVVYMLLVLPADVTITSVYNEYTFLQMAELSPALFVSACVVGIALWAGIIYLGRKKGTLLLFVLPYLLFCGFSAAVYFCLHHTGIALLFMMFWLWATIPSPTVREWQLPDSEVLKVSVRSAAVVLAALMTLVSLYWGIASGILDIFVVYSSGRNEAAFLSENGLDDYRIMISWQYEPDSSGDSFNGVYMNVNNFPTLDTIAAYFDQNIFYNVEQPYSNHKLLTEEESEATLTAWAQADVPDVMFMTVPLQLLPAEQGKFQYSDYALVYEETTQKIWKGTTPLPLVRHAKIYVRRELCEEKNLTEIENGLTTNYTLKDAEE